jgi:hypothetical protein
VSTIKLCGGVSGRGMTIDDFSVYKVLEDDSCCTCVIGVSLVSSFSESPGH